MPIDNFGQIGFIGASVTSSAVSSFPTNAFTFAFGRRFFRLPPYMGKWIATAIIFCHGSLNSLISKIQICRLLLSHSILRLHFSKTFMQTCRHTLPLTLLAVMYLSQPQPPAAITDISATAHRPGRNAHHRTDHDGKDRHAAGRQRRQESPS